jgi:hypothetical protein
MLLHLQLVAVDSAYINTYQSLSYLLHGALAMAMAMAIAVIAILPRAHETAWVDQDGFEFHGAQHDVLETPQRALVDEP